MQGNSIAWLYPLPQSLPPLLTEDRGPHLNLVLDAEQPNNAIMRRNRRERIIHRVWPDRSSPGQGTCGRARKTVKPLLRSVPYQTALLSGYSHGSACLHLKGRNGWFRIFFKSPQLVGGTLCIFLRSPHRLACKENQCVISCERSVHRLRASASGGAE